MHNLLAERLLNIHARAVCGNGLTQRLLLMRRYSKGDVAELRAEIEALKASMGGGRGPMGGGMGGGMGNGKPTAGHTEAVVV